MPDRLHWLHRRSCAPGLALRLGSWMGLFMALFMALFMGLGLGFPALAAPSIPPAPDHHVTDHAGVLSPAALGSLERRLTVYEHQTGHQIVIWIDLSTGRVPIETFAVDAFEHWRLGQAGLDDGLGMFVMVEDRALRIEVGYGLEATITDMFAGEVIRDLMIPAIQARDWDRAIVSGTEAIVDRIEGHPNALPDDPTPTAGTAEQAQPRAVRLAKIIGISILVIGFLILLILNPQLALLLFLGGRGGRGGGVGPGGGFGGGGGRSGGGGATGHW